MIKHIVLWKFRDQAEGHTKEENMDTVRARLLALQGVVPQLKSMQIGKDVLHSDMSFDMGLICAFDSLEDLQAYKVHPAHQAVSAFVKLVRTDRVSLDFEV